MSYYFIFEVTKGVAAAGISDAKRISPDVRSAVEGKYIKLVVDAARYLELHNEHPTGLRMVEYGPGTGEDAVVLGLDEADTTARETLKRKAASPTLGDPR